jgi:hypothetical protein
MFGLVPAVATPTRQKRLLASALSMKLSVPTAIPCGGVVGSGANVPPPKVRSWFWRQMAGVMNSDALAR